MPEIAYVCLSDLHFGQETSLLTNLATASTDTDPLYPSPVLKGLVECLKGILQKCGSAGNKPTLILNGDVLDLALSPIDEAGMAFDRFIELTMPEQDPLFSRIIAIPGNHDHHLWQSARDTQYVNYVTSGKFKPGSKLPKLWNATNVFMPENPLPSYLLQGLIRRFEHLKDMVVPIAYPTFGVLSTDRKKALIFNHGHYIESLYLIMSDLKAILMPGKTRPPNVWDIEAENGAWIDFFWSAMGDAGEVGKGIETIYDKLNAPDEVTKLLCNFVKGIIGKDTSIPDVVLDNALFYALSPLVGYISDRERSKGGPALSKDGPALSENGEKGLRWYMSGPLLSQIRSELKDPGTIPEVTFLFGHTHKPFKYDMTFSGFSGWVHTYNTGGWVVDTPDPEPSHGGAMVLIDENLEAVSVRMYNEDQQGQIFAESATRGSQGTGWLLSKVTTLLKGKGPWQSFPETVAESLSVRREHLRNRIYGGKG